MVGDLFLLCFVVLLTAQSLCLPTLTVLLCDLLDSFWLWLDPQGCSYHRNISKKKTLVAKLWTVRAVSHWEPLCDYVAVKPIRKVPRLTELALEFITHSVCEDLLLSYYFSYFITYCHWKDNMKQFLRRVDYSLLLKNKFHICYFDVQLCVCVCPSCILKYSVVGWCDYEPDSRQKAFHLKNTLFKNIITR